MAQSQELAEAQRQIEALVQPTHDDLSVQRALSRTPRSMMWAFHLIKKAFLCLHDGVLHPATYAVAVDMLVKYSVHRDLNVAENILALGLDGLGVCPRSLCL